MALKMFTLQVTLKLLSGKSHTADTLTLRLSLLNKPSTDKPTLDVVLLALSAEMVILLTAHTFKSLFLKSINLWVTAPPLLMVKEAFMLVG